MLHVFKTNMERSNNNGPQSPASQGAKISGLVGGVAGSGPLDVHTTVPFAVSVEDQAGAVRLATGTTNTSVDPATVGPPKVLDSEGH